MGLLFGGLAIYPFLEAWITGDKRAHNIADRPRNVPVRTGLGAAGITFYGVLWLAGSNDILSHTFQISLFATTWIFRIALIVGPILAFIITKRICLGLQRRDRATLEHGYESGTITQLPGGEFIEVHKESSPETVEVLQSAKYQGFRTVPPTVDANGVESPAARGFLGKLRIRLAHWYTKDNVSFEDVVPHSALHGEQRTEEKAGQH